MLNSNSTPKGIFDPLADYARRTDPRLPLLWRQAGIKTVSQSQALRKIEDFVCRIEDSLQPAFMISTTSAGNLRVSDTAVGRSLLTVLPYLGLFDSYHDYSEKPYAFLEACWMMECIHLIDLQRIGLNPQFAEVYYPTQLNELIAKIRMSTRQGWYRRGMSDRRYESKKRAERINLYVADLLYRHYQLLVIRLDFGYPEHMRGGLTIDRVYADLEEFLYLKGWHPFFDHLKGYVWAIEDGILKGPHIHLDLLFDGQEVCEDITLGEMIRTQLWDKRITRFEGSSWNSNIHKERFSDVGVGMIKRDDPVACWNAIRVATYLAKDPHHPEVKDPQYLRIKPAGRDAFGTGELDPEPSRAGRPRTKPILWTPENMVGIRWPN